MSIGGGYSNNASRCCMYTRLLVIDPFYFFGFNELQYIDTMNMANGGWSTRIDTYTKICNYNYPTNFKNYGDLYNPKTLVYTSLYRDDKWLLYCDGGAQALAASVAAVTALTISLY